MVIYLITWFEINAKLYFPPQTQNMGRERYARQKGLFNQYVMTACNSITTDNLF